MLELLTRQQTLMLATVSAEGHPTASYAPFVRGTNSFFIYTSGLSRHTSDLLATRKATVMFIEDEKDADNPFARRRLTLNVNVHIVDRTRDLHEKVMLHFAKRFGKVFELIRPLGDFTLFQLTPISGTYVQGFGRAFHVDETLSQLVHINPSGMAKEK